MKVAVVSDIHANKQAFEAVLEAIDKSDAEELWCLGDLVGYGADPNFCVETADRFAAICLAGNHDLGVCGEISTQEFTRGAALAADWTRETLTDRNFSYLRALKPLDTEQEVGLYHASPRDPIWEYVLSALQAELCMDVQTHKVCLVGHSHVPLSFWRLRGDIAKGETKTAGDEVDISSGEWLLNPGSVGQPRDGDPRAAWLFLDLDSGMARWERTEYDIGKASAAIRAARLPDSLADRLQYGQ